MSATAANAQQTESKYNHDKNQLNIISSTDNLRQVSTESIEEPTPTEPPQRMVHFTSDTPKFADPSSNTTPYSSNKVHPISISAPTSNSITKAPTIEVTPFGHDDRLHDILEHHNGISAHTHTIRSLQYLHSLRVKDNLFPTSDGNAYYESSPILTSPQTKSQYTPNTTINTNEIILRRETHNTHVDDLEEEEIKMNDSISDWTLKFVSPIREKQFRIFVTERYGTSIRVAILAMIVAYIFLAGTNGSFVKDTVRITFVCLGLSVMLITFSIASSFSTASSSSTISYLKALFQLDKTHDNNEKTEKKSNKKHIENTGKRNKHVSRIITLATYCRSVFGLYSNFMTAVCVISLLLLLILQNTVGGGSLPDDKFLVYYLLSSLVTSTYGSLGYRVYLMCAWSLWLIWNILAITVSNTGESRQSFDFWQVNIVLILGQLVMGHQVKAKERARRKSFLRAMNYVHQIHQPEITSNGGNLVITPRPYTTPNTAHRTSGIDAGFDIISIPTYRDKLINVLEAVDKSLVIGTNNKKRDSGSVIAAFASSGSNLHGSPKKRPRGHGRQKSKLYDAMRRDLTKRGTVRDNLNPQTGVVSELGTKLGLINKRESNALGIFNMIRGLGGNLLHLETHNDTENDNTVSDLSRMISMDSPKTKSVKSMLKDRTGGIHMNNSEEMEEKYIIDEAGNDASLLQTVQSGRKLDNNIQADMQVFFEDSIRNTEPHCGSVHELPKWYGATMESYILTGYRINYDITLCVKSMFQKHNETMNIWTEFIPALILFIFIIYFNLDNNGHFWASSDYHSFYTKSILYVSMPFIMLRPIISGLAHTFTCISKRASKVWWKLDFLSIIVAAGFGSVIWIHCIFYCETNLQGFCMFAIVALSFSTTMTALTTKNKIIRDLSLGAFFVFTLIFLYLYELYILFLSNNGKNIPYDTMIYWTISVSCTLTAVIFRASKIPEAFFVKRRFKKLMAKTYEEKFCIENDINEVNDTDEINEEIETIEALPTIDRHDIKIDSNGKQMSFKQQMSFAKMLQDIQSFTLQTENRLAKIENMDKHLYDDMDNESLKERKKQLELEIEKLENEIVNEIKNELTVEQCLEMAYVNLISTDNKQWFNYLFTSHNFWHIFMNLAVMFSVIAWKEYFNWRAQQKNHC